LAQAKTSIIVGWTLITIAVIGIVVLLAYSIVELGEAGLPLKNITAYMHRFLLYFGILCVILMVGLILISLREIHVVVLREG
jgi:hypothetical protein